MCFRKENGRVLKKLGRRERKDAFDLSKTLKTDPVEMGRSERTFMMEHSCALYHNTIRQLAMVPA